MKCRCIKNKSSFVLNSKSVSIIKNVVMFVSVAMALSVQAQNDKVTICHNGHSIMVSINAIPAHMEHGDFIGDCDNPSNVKVDICHNGHIINVSINAVPAHLAHGDAIGTVCPDEPIRLNEPNKGNMNDNYLNRFIDFLRGI